MRVATDAPKDALSPVPLTAVTIEDRFWAPRLRVNREATIPHAYAQCEETGRIEAFRLAWRPGMEPRPHFFWDSDVAKWLEAACFALATHPDREHEALVERVVALIASAQQSDGYLNTYFTMVEPERRWTDLRDAHELYCAGHLIEAGVAHYAATGRRTLLDVVSRYADHIGGVFGRAPGQKRGYCGHEEIELALVKLHQATGDARYLNLARYFVDERGTTPYYFAVEAAERGTPGHFGGFMDHMRDSARYNQSHQPVREQDEAVGHSVRAMYLYSAMADLARADGDAALRAACDRLWQDVVGRHMYLTGGVGSSAANEGFTGDYDLPNETAYAETCATCGLVFWAHRMLHLDGDGRYADVMERALYNGVLSGVSLDGRRFFYANPLASLGGAHRQAWFGCACCPPNVARLLASLGAYVASQGAAEAAVHLYAQGSMRLNLAGEDVRLRQRTDYPWEGRVVFEVGLGRAVRFALRLRLPGWCRGPALRVNGEAQDLAACAARGYARIERVWVDGDRVELDLPMPVERVYAHPEVAADVGRVALQRGPLVYCLEGVDNAAHPVHRTLLPAGSPFAAAFEADTLGGVVVLTGSGASLDDDGFDARVPYRYGRPGLRTFPVRAVPYCLWDNREPGEMRVWLPEVQLG